MAEFRAGLSGALPPPRDLTEFQVGQSECISLRFPTESVSDFATIIGDDNPLHLDEEYASTTRFKRCIVHGTLYSGLIGTVLGTRLPGPGTILVAQSHNFCAPVFVGDTVTATVQISSIDKQTGTIELETRIKNEDGTTVLTGTATTRIAR